VTSTRDLLQETASAAADFLEGLADRRVGAEATLSQLRASLDLDLGDEPVDPSVVIRELRASSDPGLVATGSGRYFGFVIGGVLPAALAADWLTSTWDQNAGLYAAGPAAAVVEEAAGRWLKQLLGLPTDASFAFVTGCQMAHFTALAAARFHVLERAGWDVEEQGLAGAPPIRVVVGADRHVTVDRALRYLGIGRRALVPVETDGQGRMLASALAARLAESDDPTVVCAQVGEVNTGGIDPVGDICDIAHEVEAWVHVDGAFGLWASASPSLRHLTEGVERADSWATDAHKWLNVPYDSGLAFCAHPSAHRRAIGVHAPYLMQAGDEPQRDQVDWTPEFSRRARGFPIYAALRSLGRVGVAELIDNSCRHARALGEGLSKIAGVEVLNDVVLNQVLVRFDKADDRTRAVVQSVQEEGTCWLSGTLWRDRAAMRISVSSWRTTEEDVDRTIEAIQAALKTVRPAG
jgi:glutamate/tyrosine decarboxylase-like PLP-dependent enzyme